MSQVRQLYRLQQYDNEITQKKRRLAEVVHLQRETEELLAARERAAQTAAEVTQLTTTQTDLNLELGGVNDKAKRSEQRLYSGQVTNPKELEDLQNEVAALGRRRAVLEDELLETMIMLEDAQEANDNAAKALEQINTAWRSSQASLKEEQNELALHLHKLMTERAKHEARIDAASLAEYDAIRKRANGVAVVALVNNACTGCYVGVSSNVALKAGRGERVICTGCGRILFSD